MAEKMMKVVIEQVGTAAFEATGGSGGRLVVDGAPEIGGEGRGMRPMEVLLTAVATCSAMDIVHILKRQRQVLEHLHVEIEGARPDTTPSPFSRIKMIFVARGTIEESKLTRAVGLAVEKYCSARANLAPEVEVTWEARLEAAAT